MDAMRHRWIDRETCDRLIAEMTRVQQFACDPEILAGQHHHLGFVALIRHGDAFVALLDALRPDHCLAAAQHARSTAARLSPDPVRTDPQRDHRSKPTSIAFLALGGFVAINWALGLAWIAYKLASLGIGLVGAAFSYL